MAPFKRQITYSQRPNHAARSAHAKGERQFRTYDTSGIRPKRSKAPGIIAAVVALLVVALLAWGVFSLIKGCTGPQTELLAEGEQATVVVEQGAGANDVAKSLQKAGLVASVQDFAKRVSDRGAEAALLPGTYTFTGGMTADELIDELKAGPGMTGTPLSIPEGFTLSAIADRVAEVTGGRVSADDFKAAASDASVYAADFPFLADAGTNSLEGFLFPKTYAVEDTDTADSIIRDMLAQYQTEVATLDYNYPSGKGFSNYQALILASIVEKESSAEADVRAKVAAVFYNRLLTQGEPAYGMLGSDATTAYELGGEPTNYDWSTDSPYNTRVHAGLPPTPICSPSIESLQAVCAPAADFGDVFFFSFWPNDAGGVDYFFDKTYEEHQATIAAHS